MKAAILSSLQAHRKDGIMLKKLKKECMGDDLTSLTEHTDAKKRFKIAYDALLNSEKIIEDVKGLVTLNETADRGNTEAPLVQSAALSSNNVDSEELDASLRKEKKEKREKKEKKEKEEKRDRIDEKQLDSDAGHEEYNHDEEEPPAAKKAKWEKGPAKVKGDRDGGVAENGRPGDRYELYKNGEQAWRDKSLPQDYLTNNPDGITRLFCGNLKLDVTEEALLTLLPGITYIRWQKDKTTKKFYGSTFLEMKDSRCAAQAVAMDGNKFMGRPLKIYYCPPQPGTEWPPAAGTAGNSAYRDSADGETSAPARGANGLDPMGVGRGYSQRAKTPRPPGCKKLYAGNLAYTIDDDKMVEFFKDCGEMIGLRWLTNKDTGEFRGCGFVEFSQPEEAEAAMKLDGVELLGRPIRLDWTA